MKNMVADEGMSSEIVHQLARIASALESGASLGVKGKVESQEHDSEMLRNVQAIGWLFYLREKNGKASKRDVAKAMGFHDHSSLRSLQTFGVLFDRIKIAESANLRGGSVRRNGRNGPSRCDYDGELGDDFE